MAALPRRGEPADGLPEVEPDELAVTGHRFERLAHRFEPAQRQARVHGSPGVGHQLADLAPDPGGIAELGLDQRIGIGGLGDHVEIGDHARECRHDLLDLEGRHRKRALDDAARVAGQLEEMRAARAHRLQAGHEIAVIVAQIGGQLAVVERLEHRLARLLVHQLQAVSGIGDHRFGPAVELGLGGEHRLDRHALDPQVLDRADHRLRHPALLLVGLAERQGHEHPEITACRMRDRAGPEARRVRGCPGSPDMVHIGDRLPGPARGQQVTDVLPQHLALVRAVQHGRAVEGREHLQLGQLLDEVDPAAGARLAALEAHHAVEEGDHRHVQAAVPLLEEEPLDRHRRLGDATEHHAQRQVGLLRREQPGELGRDQPGGEVQVLRVVDRAHRQVGEATEPALVVVAPVLARGHRHGDRVPGRRQRPRQLGLVDDARGLPLVLEVEKRQQQHALWSEAAQERTIRRMTWNSSAWSRLLSRPRILARALAASSDQQCWSSRIWVK